MKKLINNTITEFGLDNKLKLKTKHDFENKTLKELFRINLIKKSINIINNNELQDYEQFSNYNF